MDRVDPPRTFWSRLVPRGSHLLAFAVLVAALVLVGATWRSARQREMRAAEQEFVADTDEIIEVLRQRLAQYELMTRGGVSLFASVARPTPRQWQAYAEGMGVADRYPALLGLGFTGYVPNARLPDLQIEWRDSGYGMLNIRPRGIRADYAPILYLEPRRPENVAAIGFDLYSEALPRAAMSAAIDTGRPQLTGPVQLVQDGPTARTGVMLCLPIYRAGDQPASVAARRESMQGWIYAPFHVREFVETVLGGRLVRTHLRIADITDGRARPLYDGGVRVVDPAFTRNVDIDVYGRRWRYEFSSLPVANAVPGLHTLQGTLTLGLIAALLLYGVAFALARTGTRARRRAAVRR